MPLIAVDVYLASSRGGVIVALVGAAALLALAADRWAALGSILITAVGAASAVALVARDRTFVDGPLGSDLGIYQGHRAALFVAGVCLATGLVSLLFFRRPLPRPPAFFGWLLAAIAAGGLVAAIGLAHPVRRFDEFKQPPSSVSYDVGNFASSHLASGASNGRWQFWTSAVDEWRAHPVRGGGAGSFGEWWSAHAPITYFIRDAHSLYLQVLGELGLVGLLLLCVPILLALGLGVRRALRLQGPARTAVAGLVGVGRVGPSVPVSTGCGS